MVKRSLHICLALLMALVSLASSHYHADEELLSFDIDSNSHDHCVACDLKSVLQTVDISPRFTLILPAHYKFLFQPSLATAFIDCTLFFISLRAPPKIV